MMKEDMRAISSARRNALSKQSIEKDSKRICEQLLPYMKGFIALYESYGAEVDVSYLKAYCEQYALPKSNTNKTLTFYEIHEETKLVQGLFGIMEPNDGVNVPPEAFDVLIVPLVAFDDECHRLGHGLGYYDRFLTKCKGLKIGVAFDCQKMDSISIHPWDIDLDMIVTPTTIYQRRIEE